MDEKAEQAYHYMILQYSSILHKIAVTISNQDLDVETFSEVQDLMIELVSRMPAMKSMIELREVLKKS